MKQDLHIHTSFCDGRNSPEEMVLAGIAAGLDRIGICTHSYTFFDESYCIPKARYTEFQSELHRLKEKYRDSIEVLCGVEQDMYSDMSTAGFDYVIGSMHYMEINGEYIPVDNDAETLLTACEKYFGGDAYKLAEYYFSLEAQVAKRTHCDIIGHFDLISKFNERTPMFDTDDERYVKASENALNELLKAGVPFEINTGAISRGYRSSPYPNSRMLEYIKANGGKLLLSSDSHSSDTVAYLFEKYAALVM